METGKEKQLLHVKDLGFAYEKKQPILQDITIDAYHGESIGLIGANGVGKSTFLKLLVGLDLDYTGTSEIAHHPVTRENLNHVREHIGYVFQDSDSQLFLTTVEEDVAFGPRNYGLSEQEVKERVDEALRLMHIEALRHKHNYTLSGGEKKLASIATILSMHPDIVLMDEPSVALDPKNRRHLISLLNEMEPMKIIASHDLDFIMDTCERTILMWQGQIIADGPTEEILTDRTLLEAHGLELPLRCQ